MWANIPMFVPWIRNGYIWIYLGSPGLSSHQIWKSPQELPSLVPSWDAMGVGNKVMNGSSSQNTEIQEKTYKKHQKKTNPK